MSPDQKNRHQYVFIIILSWDKQNLRLSCRQAYITNLKNDVYRFENTLSYFYTYEVQKCETVIDTNNNLKQPEDKRGEKEWKRAS